MTTLAKDINGNIMQCVGLGATQVVNYDASTQSTQFAASTKVIRIVSTTDCHIAVSSSPTATTSSAFLPANVIEYIEARTASKIAVIKSATAGKLYVTETV